MAGGYLGYIYVFAGCGAMVAVVLASALLLYGWSKLRGRRGEPRVRVVAVRGEPGPRDAA